MRTLLAVAVAAALSSCGHRGHCEKLHGEPTVPGYIGLTRADAQQRASAEHLTFRVMCIDGVGQSGTADRRSDRVNVGLDDDRVVTAQRY